MNTNNKTYQLTYKQIGAWNAYIQHTPRSYFLKNFAGVQVNKFLKIQMFP